MIRDTYRDHALRNRACAWLRANDLDPDGPAAPRRRARHARAGRGPG